TTTANHSGQMIQRCSAGFRRALANVRGERSGVKASIRNRSLGNIRENRPNLANRSSHLNPPHCDPASEELDFSRTPLHAGHPKRMCHSISDTFVSALPPPSLSYWKSRTSLWLVQNASACRSSRRTADGVRAVL